MLVAPLLPWSRAVTRTRYGNSVKVLPVFWLRPGFPDPRKVPYPTTPSNRARGSDGPAAEHVRRGRSSSTMNGATPERDESELLASQLNEAAVVAETEFDAQATLDDVQSRNPHCAVVALLPREGCEQPVGVTTSPAGLEVPPASVKLLNAAFFPAEHGEEVIRLCGRELRVIERVEEGAHFLLVLSSGESSGGYAEYTQRGILLVLYDAGMTAAIARQLAVGLQEYVVSDGV